MKRRGKRGGEAGVERPGDKIKNEVISIFDLRHLTKLYLSSSRLINFFSNFSYITNGIMAKKKKRYSIKYENQYRENFSASQNVAYKETISNMSKMFSSGKQTILLLLFKISE